VRHWWVNQNQTHKVELAGGFLWSPKTARGGRSHHFYDTMKEVAAGDLIFSFYDTFIQAVGVAQGPASTAPKPEFGTAGDPWDSSGWLVEVDYWHLPVPFRPREYMQLLAPLLPDKYSPLRANGDGLQGVYLTEISSGMSSALALAGGIELDVILQALVPTPSIDESAREEPEVPSSQDPKSVRGAVEREQLTLARRGQGVFKYNVRLIESHCRLTGVTDHRHLRASHIKPWRVATDAEKVDGANGLLLSPHVDHLFDRGLISFRQDGQVLQSPLLPQDVMNRWHLDSVRSAGAFNADQDSYLEYHRDAVLRQA